MIETIKQTPRGLVAINVKDDTTYYPVYNILTRQTLLYLLDRYAPETAKAIKQQHLTYEQFLNQYTEQPNKENTNEN